VSIGFIDSGIGGLTTFRLLREKYPYSDYIYIGDTLYAPYGNLKPEVLFSRIRELTNFLRRKGVDAVVLACNTSSARVGGDCSVLPLIRVLPPVDLALRETRRDVLLLCTALTASSEYVQKRMCGRLIVKGMKNLATLIEEVAPSFHILEDFLTEALLPYSDCEAVILGCTHYAYLTPVIQKILPGKKIFDGSDFVADSARSYMKEENGLIEFHVTGGTRLNYKQLFDSFPPNN